MNPYFSLNTEFWVKDLLTSCKASGDGVHDATLGHHPLAKGVVDGS